MYFQLERHLDNLKCIPLLLKYVKRMFCNSAYLRILFHNLKVITSFTDDKDTNSFAVQKWKFNRENINCFSALKIL